jgi:hypothetical protein
MEEAEGLGDGAAGGQQSTRLVVGVCSSSGHVRVLQLLQQRQPNPLQSAHGTASASWQVETCLGAVQLPGEVFSSPVLAAGFMVLGCRDDHLYCLRCS